MTATSLAILLAALKMMEKPAHPPLPCATTMEAEEVQAIARTPQTMTATSQVGLSVAVNQEATL